MERKLTLGILPPADLDEVLDIGDFGRHLGGPEGVAASTGGELGVYCWFFSSRRPLLSLLCGISIRARASGNPVFTALGMNSWHSEPL